VIGDRRGQLPSGLIFEVARRGDLECRGSGEKRALRCPFHEDKTPSAFLSVSNVFYCSVCTPERGWGARRFAEELGVSWEVGLGWQPQGTHDHEPFTAVAAQTLWERVLARALDDDVVEEDRATYAYLDARSLMEAWEERVVGVLGPLGSVHSATAQWFRQDYRLVAPLYSQDGVLTNVQARAIVAERKPKTMFPWRSRAKETLFADLRGLRLLRGDRAEVRSVVLAEGLTDFLALAPRSPVPVLSAPGTGMSVSSIGPWVRGLHVYLALDRDEAGERARGPSAHRAYEFGAARVSQVVWPGEHKDACAFLEAVGESALDEFLVAHLGGNR